MPPWLIYALGGFVAEMFKKVKRKGLRAQLQKDFDEIEKMDIPEIERKALRQALVEKYNNESE